MPERIKSPITSWSLELGYIISFDIYLLKRARKLVSRRLVHLSGQVNGSERGIYMFLLSVSTPRPTSLPRQGQNTARLADNNHHQV